MSGAIPHYLGMLLWHKQQQLYHLIVFRSISSCLTINIYHNLVGSMFFGSVLMCAILLQVCSSISLCYVLGSLEHRVEYCNCTCTSIVLVVSSIYVFAVAHLFLESVLKIAKSDC
jgi:hypothetical protein